MNIQQQQQQQQQQNHHPRTKQTADETSFITYKL